MWGFNLKRLVLVLAAALAGCSNIEHKPRGFATESFVESQDCTKPPTAKPRKIAIFFDGTANDEGSDTNVKRLHSLVTLQNKGNIASLYLQGVGVSNDITGAVTGAGTNPRVKIAYEFILNHYQPASCSRPADEIYIFGFSRGAYSARILATMLFYGGLVKSKDNPYYTSTELAGLVHNATFAPLFQDVNQAVRIKKIKDFFKEKKLITLPIDGQVLPITVKVLGLWDTVEALGPKFFIPTTPAVNLRSTFPEVNIDTPNGRYGERLCNVEKAYHAVSIDDNRATIFTPLLLTRKHLFVDCPRGKKESDNNIDFYSPMLNSDGTIRKNHLQEVWFSGAHSDVGGGYLNSSLSGVSLNWMIDRLRDTDLLPEHSAVRQDIFGSSHNPASGSWSVLYPDVSRNIVAFALNSNEENQEGFKDSNFQVKAPRNEFAGSICVHPSVFQRREMIPPKPHEYGQLQLHSLPSKPVELVLKPYGKGHDWYWPVERTDSTEISVGQVMINKYPSCKNIELESKQ